ncbi:hypothetical protein RB195_015674 [Necator americanus]|uniref:Reverse transcriptase domain-containing protein n=1 Tax=Necator americanus TaxID=51031 RepID=A0ABR1E5M7_NECAM
MPLSLPFIDLKKAFDTVESEAVMEALYNQGVPNPYIRILRELYSNFTTKIFLLYSDITIVGKREFFTPIFANAMHGLEWDDVGVKADGWHFCFAGKIVLITSSSNQEERMQAGFD